MFNYEEVKLEDLADGEEYLCVSEYTSFSTKMKFWKEKDSFLMQGGWTDTSTYIFLASEFDRFYKVTYN